MSHRFQLLLVALLTTGQSAVAEKYEPFDSLQSANSHGWSIYSSTTDFTANVVPTSRAAGTSGPGEAEIIVSPVPFAQSAYFADTHLGSNFTLDEDFSFSGKLRLEGLDPGDSMQIVIGFFDSQAARSSSYFEKPSHVGLVMATGSVDIGIEGIGLGYALYPHGSGGSIFPLEFGEQEPLEVSVQFTADDGFGGDGYLSAKIGSSTAALYLVNYGDDDPIFDAFGVLAWGSTFLGETTSLTIVLDDVQYSTLVPEPSSIQLFIIAYLSFSLFNRCVRREEEIPSVIDAAVKGFACKVVSKVL